MSRTSNRRDMSPDVRVQLLEEDLDKAEENIVVAKRELNDQIVHTKNTARTLVEGVKVDVKEQLNGFRAEIVSLRTEMHLGFEQCEQRDNQTRKLLTGLLVSIVTLCVTVTVGVLVALGGG